MACTGTNREPPSVAKSARSLFGIAPPMHGLDVFRMVIAPGSSHSFWLSVVRYDVATVGKFMLANGTLPSLLHDFSVQELSHLCRRTEFAVSPGMVRIIDALNTKPKSAFFSLLLATAAEE